MFYKKITVLTLSLICFTSCTDKASPEITDTQAVKFSSITEYKTEVSENSSFLPAESTETDEEEIEWDVAYSRPKALDKITDEIIRTDYAEYISERDGTKISADNVYGVFNFGTENKYRILVMCPSEIHTDDIKTLHLQSIPHHKDDCDRYSCIDVELPSGSYEAFAYRHGQFYPLEEAINDKLVSYNMSEIIDNYMTEYYNRAIECVYTVE